MGHVMEDFAYGIVFVKGICTSLHLRNLRREDTLF